MGGKRRDYDGAFAMLDINFVIDDPRLDGLSAAARWVYITLWCLAVRERSEVLTYYKFVSSLARLSRVRPSTTVKSLIALEQNCLISRDAEGIITVIGVKDKHKNLTWKECGINGNMPPNKTTDKKKNKKEEEEGVYAPLSETMTPEEFDEYCPRVLSIYPRKAEPIAAKEQLAARVGTGADPELLILCAKNYAVDVETLGTEGKYIMLAKNFFGYMEKYKEYAPGTWTPEEAKKNNEPIEEEIPYV